MIMGCRGMFLNEPIDNLWLEIAFDPSVAVEQMIFKRFDERAAEPFCQGDFESLFTTPDNRRRQAATQGQAA